MSAVTASSDRDNYREPGSKCITDTMYYLLSLRQRCPTTVFPVRPVESFIVSHVEHELTRKFFSACFTLTKDFAARHSGGNR